MSLKGRLCLLIKTAPAIVAGDDNRPAVVYRAILQPSVRLIHADNFKMLCQPFHLRLEGFWRRA
jgi:hypothetical protein